MDKLYTIFESARWAASAFNEQPWSFVVATKQEDPEGYHRMFECLRPANREWAGGAPCLILATARERFSHKDTANRHAWHDVGIATGFLWLEAIHLGLCCHPMAGFDPLLARTSFEIPNGTEPVTIIALGYQGHVSQLSERLQKRETCRRERRGLAEICYARKWGNPAEFALGAIGTP